MSAEPFDAVEFRKALSCFLTGVTVVTTIDRGGQPRGYTANSFKSVSLDPPLVLVCIAETAQSYDVFSETEHFGINILSEDHHEVSNVFASKHPEKFTHVRWNTGGRGSPLFDDAVAWLDCEVHNRVRAGDHTILIGRVVDFIHSARRPLGYCRSNYLRFGLDQKALATIEARKRKVGAVLESKGRVLFLTDSEGRLSLPAHATLGEEGKDAAGLIGLLQSISVQSEIEFLFAVYEDTRGGFNVYYRGSLVGDSVPDPARARLIAFDEIPWDELPDDAMRAMLRRYISEREEDLFGVYVGDTKSGDVRRLGTR